MHSLQVQRQTGEFRSSNWNRHLLWKATWRRTDSDQPKIFLVNLASESITLPVHQDDSVHNSGSRIPVEDLSCVLQLVGFLLRTRRAKGECAHERAGMSQAEMRRYGKERGDWQWRV